MFISRYLFNRQADMIRKYTAGFSVLCQEDNVQFYFEGKHQSCTSLTERTERNLLSRSVPSPPTHPQKMLRKKKKPSMAPYTIIRHPLPGKPPEDFSLINDLIKNTCGIIKGVISVPIQSTTSYLGVSKKQFKR